jgi:large subunit ribosomal protein L17
MRHGFKKAKFANGMDADRMLMRKLMVNFFTHGKIASTISKIKALRPEVEKAVTKIKKGGEADKNYLLQKLGGNYEKLAEVFKEIASQLNKVQSGYTKIIKQGNRESDGALTAQLTWAYPVVLPKEAKVVKAKKAEVKSEKEVKSQVKSK